MLPLHMQILPRKYALPILFCLLWLATVLSPALDLFAREPEEYAVKAAFVLNFAKVTNWPDTTFQDSPENIDLCVVGDEHLIEAFQSIDGKQVGQRILRIRNIATASDSKDCEMLFVGNDIDRAALLRYFAAVKGRPVLTIGEIPDFAKIGGVINFISRNGRLNLFSTRAGRPLAG